MSAWHVWRHPVWIGALTAAGLVAGLVSDGWGDALAAVGLAVPSVVCAFALCGGLRRARRVAVRHDPSLSSFPRELPREK